MASRKSVASKVSASQQEDLQVQGGEIAGGQNLEAGASRFSATSGVAEPLLSSDSASDVNDQWRLALDVLALRVGILIDEDRSPDDVPNHQRGRVFPTRLILRDVLREPPAAATAVIPWDLLPETLTTLASYLPLEAEDLAILLVASAAALDPRFEHFFVALNNDVDSRGASVNTALRLAGLSPLDPDARERLRSDAPLTVLGLVEVGPLTRGLLSQVITVPERVIAHLLGRRLPDPQLTRAIIELSEETLPDELLPSIVTPSTPPVILRARSGTAGLDQARRIASSASGEDPLVIDFALFGASEGLDAQPDFLNRFIKSCLRECALSAINLVIDFRQCGPDAPIQEILAEFNLVGAPVILLVDPRRALGPWERQAITLPLPTFAQRRQWWELLAPDADPLLASTATHLDPQDIREANEKSESLVLARVSGSTRRSRVQTVKPALGLSDVILAERPARMLRSLCDRVRFRSTVLDEWGMRPGGARGRGVTALFAGPAGTGKTMSGEAIAWELGVPLFVVDLASVVDKYIGETEKNLEDVFRTVENEDGVLLFDEADALFGKRSDVSDARDRYANIEVAYLLQRIEAFDGLAILTTNLRANLDEAFQRRLDMIVDFPEPDSEARAEIWRAALGPFTGSLTEADCIQLATLDITGGYIRAAMVSAAYLAAARGESLNRTHVLEGVREEWRKAGRLNFPEATFADWE